MQWICSGHKRRRAGPSGVAPSAPVLSAMQVVALTLWHAHRSKATARSHRDDAMEHGRCTIVLEDEFEPIGISRRQPVPCTRCRHRMRPILSNLNAHLWRRHGSTCTIAPNCAQQRRTVASRRALAHRRLRPCASSHHRRRRGPSRFRSHGWRLFSLSYKREFGYRKVGVTRTAVDPASSIHILYNQAFVGCLSVSTVTVCPRYAYC